MRKLAVALALACASVAVLLAATVTDDFNRADSGSLGANWTSTLGISSNRACAQDNNFNPATYVGSGAGTVTGWDADQSIEIVGFYTTGGFGQYFVEVRNNGTDVYYTQFVVSSATYTVVKVQGGSTTLASGVIATAIGAPFTMRMEATGTSTTTLKVYLNGIQLGSDIVDSSTPITSGNSANFAISTTDAANSHCADDFTATGAQLSGGGSAFPSAIINAPIICCRPPAIVTRKRLHDQKR